MRTRREKWSQVSEPLRTLVWIFVALFFVIFVLGLLEILGFIPSLQVFDFLSGLLAGISGILIGFSLDRISEVDKDNQTKNDFLKLVREELLETKKNIYPQSNVTHILYADIWDSMVSSGMLRLLTIEQVTKLSRVYRSIKGASYEAEWIRRNSEELDSLSGEAEPQVAVANKLIANVARYKRRLEELTKEIDSVLKENWWNKS